MSRPITRYSGWTMISRPATLACLVLLAGAAEAQIQPGELEEIEQGTRDLGPLGTSMRTFTLDMEVPNDFQRLYEVEGPGGEQFVRFAGGVAAVFPRSVYIPLESGVLPDIPPSTVFYIGGLPEERFSSTLAPSPVASRNRLSYAVPQRISTQGVPPDRVTGEEAKAEPAAQVAPTPSFWEDESYRRERVTQLIHRAAEARRSRQVDMSLDED